VRHLRLALPPQAGAGFGLPLEVLKGILQPYFMLLQESI